MAENISAINLAKAARVVKFKKDSYQRIFGDTAPETITPELIEETAQARVDDEPDKDKKGQVIYVEGLVKYMTRIIENTEETIKREYDKLLVSEKAQEAVKHDANPFATMASGITTPTVQVETTETTEA